MITLREIEPAIWRRFAVPADIPLDRLHDVIQIVMGWSDYHLHRFAIGGKRYTEDPDPDLPDGSVEEEEFRLSDLVKRKGVAFEYLYDFGDNWRHNLIVEKTYPFSRDQDLIACKDGARACPPEDVGSVLGYYNFCEAIADKKHPEHDEFMGWYGKPFHGDHFDLQKVNDELLKYLRWARDRLIPWPDQLD